MEQNQTNYNQTALISVFARCLEFAKSQPQNNRNLKNIELILDKLKGGVCFGYSITYHNVGENFTKINKYIINESNKRQDQKDYKEWLLKYVDENIFQMLYGIKTINKMTNLDFIIYFCESIMIAQSPDILKLALGVNNSVNNDLQANFIQNGDFCNEFILSKDNQVLVLEAKKTTRIYYMNNKKCDEQLKLLFDNNQKILKQCKIICSGNNHIVIFQCDEKGRFRILDPNYKSGEMKCCNTLNEAIDELNRIFDNCVFAFIITYYDTKVKNKDEDHESKLQNMEKEYNKVILELDPDQLIREAKQNLLFSILANYNPDMLLQMLNMIPEDKRGDCMLAKDALQWTSFHMLARYHSDMLLQVLNMIPEDKRVECILVKNGNQWTSFHTLARYHPDMLLQVLNMIPEDKRVECILVKKAHQLTSFHTLARYHPDMLAEVLKIIPEDKILDCMLLEHKDLEVTNSLAAVINNNAKLKENLFTLFCAELNIKDVDVKDISASTVVTPDILRLFNVIRKDQKFRDAFKAKFQQGKNRSLQLNQFLQKNEADLNQYYLHCNKPMQTFSQWKNQRKYTNFAKCVVTGIVISLALLLFTQTLSDNQSQNKQ